MVGNASMTNFEKISKIIKSNGGYVTGRDVSEANIPTATLSQYIKKYNLIKQCPGFYSTEDWMADDYFIFQYQYPKLIYSFYGAAYLHRLGDFIPTSLEATAPKNYRPFPLPRDGVILHTDTRDTTYILVLVKLKHHLATRSKFTTLKRQCAISLEIEKNWIRNLLLSV